MSRLPSAMSRLPRKERREEGRGGKKEEPRTNIAQPPSELTWENAIVGDGPFNAGGRGRGPCEGKKKNSVAGGHILAASALKGPKRTITFSQVSSEGGCWGFLPDFLPSFSPPLVLPR